MFPTSGSPDINSSFDDVKQAIAQMMAQQQQGEANPRQPTPQEEAQLKQTAMAALQAKGQMPGQAPQQNPPTPAAPKPSVGGSAFMGMGGMNPSIAQQQLPPSPSQQQTPPPPASDSINEFVGPPLAPNMDIYGNTEDGDAPPTEADWQNARESIIKSLSDNLGGTVSGPASLQERYPKETRMIREGTPDQVRDAVGTIQRRLTMQEYDPSSLLPRWAQDAGKALGTMKRGGLNAKTLEGTDDINKAIQLLQSQPQKPGQPTAPQQGDTGVSEEQTHEGSPTEEATAPTAPAGSSEEDNQAMLNAANNHEAASRAAFEDHLAKNVAPQARQVANQAVKEGATNPDSADKILRDRFGVQNAQLDNAIAEARQTYQDIVAQNNKPPSVVQYIGAVLMGLAGAHPQVIQNVLHGNQALNAQREHLAGENLMKLQLGKVQGLMHQNELQMKQGADSLAQRKLDNQMAIANQREAGMDERAQSAHRLQAIKDSIDFYKSEAQKHDEAATKSVGASKKNHLQQAQAARQAAKPFEDMLRQEIQNNAKQLQQPQQQPQGGPISQVSPVGGVSPSAARLLGMGA